MTKLFALILVTLAAALGATGCGGDDDDGGGDGSQNSGQASETDSGGGGGTSGSGAQVSMKNIQFDPSDISVKAGETITFTNDEAVAHDVHKTSGPGKDFASGPAGGMQEGDTFELTLDKPGNYEYVCDVHAPGMAGTITVK
jgi:plastocyanin